MALYYYVTWTYGTVCIGRYVSVKKGKDDVTEWTAPRPTKARYDTRPCLVAAAPSAYIIAPLSERVGPDWRG